jgi:hypothetical protein
MVIRIDGWSLRDQPDQVLENVGLSADSRTFCICVETTAPISGQTGLDPSDPVGSTKLYLTQPPVASIMTRHSHEIPLLIPGVPAPLAEALRGFHDIRLASG